MAAARLRAGLADLYRFYRAGTGMLTHIHRDLATLPEAYQQALREGDTLARDVLTAPFGGTGDEHAGCARPSATRSRSGPGAPCASTRA